MGIMDFIKGQLIDVIEWTDPTGNTMVHAFNRQRNEIKIGAQLTVRESQAAVFVNEGQIADIFPPGRYELTTKNMPVLTTIKSWKYGFNSPFKAEVYFVNTKQFPNQKWGTSNPIMMRDKDFGSVRIRAFGIYSYKIDDPGTFMKEIFGTNSSYETDMLQGQLKRSLVSGIADAIAESEVPVLDLAMKYDELGEFCKDKCQARFDQFGLQLSSLYIENISLPEEVEKMLDKRTSMSIMGDSLNQYTQFQAAEALRDAAQNPSGGLASAGVGLGAGVAMGQMFGKAMGNNTMGGGGAAVTKIKCPHCGATIREDAKFCPECGKSAVVEKEECDACGAMIKKDANFCPECGEKVVPKGITQCIKCGVALKEGAKFCPECGTKQAEELKCPACGVDLKSGAKFCPECGEKI